MCGLFVWLLGMLAVGAARVVGYLCAADVGLFVWSKTSTKQKHGQ